MKLDSPNTVERLSQRLRLSMIFWWAMLALGILVLGLHSLNAFQFLNLANLQGSSLRATSIRVLYAVETGLLLIMLALVIAQGAIDRRRERLSQNLRQEAPRTIVEPENATQSDRKHTSNLLIQSTQNFRDFADAMPNLVWTADAQGRLDYGNRTLEGFLGTSEEESLLDDRWRRSIDAGDRARYAAAWQRALAQGGRFHLECLLRRFDGQGRWHSIQATPVRDNHGAIVKWYGNAINIHERKVSEDKAQDLAERLATTLESITDAFFTLDKDWRFTYVNREAERLLQRNRHELLRNNLWELFPAALGSQFEEHYRYAMDSGNKVVFEAFFEPLNFWAGVNVYPAREGLSIYFQDITDRKRSDRSKQRIRELENSRELADLANQTKSEFLASMTHEIRTPINGIVGMVDVLHQTSLRGHQVEMVDIIRESSQSLLGIVDDILDFSKIEAGKLELHPADFDPRALLRSVCLLMDRMACNHDVELTLFADPRLPEQLLGDDLRLRQILLNLVSNAIKFSASEGRKGRVRVEVKLTSNARADARSQTQRETVDIDWRVRDNGVGMTTATLSRLFNPFVQADASTTRVYGGTGLGLSITHNLVELMGGDIKVTSQLDVGTEFRVRMRLPKVKGPPNDNEVLLLSGHSILVLPPPLDTTEEDEANLTPIWSAYLTASGAAVFSEVGSGQDDEESSFSLIVFDSGDDNPGLDELRSRVPVATADNLRWLVIGRGHRRKVRRDGDAIFRIDANSLSHVNFLEAVTIALGITAPETVVAPVEGRSHHEASPSREQALANGALVLVAEDNETNREVIRQQLGLLGYAADLTANGREALERWEENPHNYAAILTDLHMPQMDGYELTQAVRQHEREQWGSRVTPVVALTANALGEEDERCQEMGMNDYLVKPVSLEELRSALERWCPPQAKGQRLRRVQPASQLNAGKQTAEKPVESKLTEEREYANTKRADDDLQPPQRGSKPVLNLNILRQFIGDEEAVLLEFLQSFWSSSERLAATIRQAGGDKNWTAVADAAHSLKSSARSVGALSLGDACMELESAAQAYSEEELQCTMAAGEQRVGRALDGFNTEWRQVQRALEATNIKSGL